MLHRSGSTATLTSVVPFTRPIHCKRQSEVPGEMKITRRKFLKSGTSAAAIGAGALLVPSIVSGQRNLGTIGLGGPRGGLDSFNAIGNYGAADFEGLIGTQFDLLSDTHGHRTVTLIGVQTPRGSKGSRTESFSLVFKGSE